MSEEQVSEGGIILPDENWKEEAAKEREVLSEEVAQKPPEQPEMSDPDLDTITAELATSVMLYIGAIEDPVNGSRQINLKMAERRLRILDIWYETMKRAYSDGCADYESVTIANRVYGELTDALRDLKDKLKEQAIKEAS